MHHLTFQLQAGRVTDSTSISSIINVVKTKIEETQLCNSAGTQISMHDNQAYPAIYNT